MNLKSIIISLFILLLASSMAAQLQISHLVTPVDSITSTFVNKSQSQNPFSPFQGNQFYKELRQHSLGFFCKAEEKRWKETKVQFKMRVGTLNQANQYERR